MTATKQTTTAYLMAVCERMGWRLQAHQSDIVSIQTRSGSPVMRPMPRGELVECIDELVKLEDARRAREAQR